MVDETREFVRKQQFKMGDRLRSLRIAKGFPSAEGFANEHGYNRVQYGRYENGANISWSTLVKLIRSLDMSIAEFFSEGFENEDEKGK